MPRGSCLCGAVRLNVDAELAGGDACHCSQCRKHSGHYFASTDVPKAALAIESEDALAWYHSSERVRRGFCQTCGSSLFWDPLASGKPGKTIVAEKGDYYDIADGLPQHLR